MRLLATAALVLGISISAVLAEPVEAANDLPGADKGALLTLSIIGNKGARVRGQCLVRAPGGVRRLDLDDDTLPIRRRWRASRLHCELRVRGRVTIEVVRRGSRSHISVSGGQITINFG